MLMRHADTNFSEDQSDGNMIDQTRRWLEQDSSNIFHLVIDELHLYRGTSGTEVSYLLKLFLHRLGLEPNSPQLRILASSASMDAQSEETFKFLAEFYGFSTEEAKEKFKVIEGEPAVQLEEE